MIKLDLYLDCASEIYAHQKRDKYLITEWCMDIYPHENAKARAWIRVKLIEHLKTLEVGQ
jgi:hypothetical protein